MPGPYVHISSMWHTAEQFEAGDYQPVGSDHITPAWAGADVGELSRLMRENPNFAAIGAVGPDLFFFLPDFRDVAGVPVASVLTGILDFLEHVYEMLDPYVSKWEHYLGPVSEDTAEEMSRLTGGLTESVGNISGELSSILITLLEDFAVNQRDWWGYFSLGLNKGYDEKAYLWSDMLHYRDTGRFGRALWNLAQGDEEGPKAYALGYLTHLATDVTGHAVVNAISGGPFRTQWQRHHLAENHIDAYWYLLDKAANAPRTTAGYEQWTESALYFDIAFDDTMEDAPLTRPPVPTGRSMRENWTRKRLLDKDSRLPEEIAQLLLDTIEAVFYEGKPEPPHPLILRPDVGSIGGRPTVKLIQEAYDVLFRYLKISTTDGIAHEVPPPPDVFPNLDFPALDDPGDPPDESDDDFWDDVLDVILAIVSVILLIVEIAVWLATVLPAALADIATYPLRITLYYAFELPLFYALKSFRMTLVMTGYLHPMSDEIAQSLVRVGNPMAGTWQQVLDEVDDTFGGMLPEKPRGDVSGEPFADDEYPHQHAADQFQHPWDYPTSPLEKTHTFAGPAAQNAGPSSLFEERPPDPAIRDGLEAATSPAAADAVGAQVTPDKHMGDAVSFSKYLVWLATRSQPAGDGPLSHVAPHPAPVVDWNLDADRGYGYHCWDWNRLPESGGVAHDPNGNEFSKPCTWPSQADDVPEAPHPVPTDIALLLHWAGLDDPGCHPDTTPADG
jgi:hypothetical protein